MHQEYDGERCICADGYGLVDNACVACAKHERGSLSGCACDKGYVRKTAGGACEEIGGLGTECATDADCLDPSYPHCQTADSSGYCTSTDCKTSDDCEINADYACNARVTPSVCERPPEGLGTECTDSSDCAGLAADFCESIVSKVCLPGGCKDDANKCHGDWVCCDITVLGNSICIPPAELESGMCPAGGTLIERPK